MDRKFEPVMSSGGVQPSLPNRDILAADRGGHLLRGVDQGGVPGGRGTG